MPTLLITLDAPMQSWGTRSRFDHRDTEMEPSKSGVIGLLAAALGRPREATISDLAALRFGVRVDRAGTLAKDFHTAQNILRAKSGRQDTAVTERYYLAEAAFTAGLEGPDRDLLVGLHAALSAPHWPLFLGRRSFPSGLPLVGSVDHHVVDSPLKQALMTFPLRPAENGEVSVTTCACVLWIEHDAPTGHVRYDQPIDDFHRRDFGPRHVHREVYDVSVAVAP